MCESILVIHHNGSNESTSIACANDEVLEAKIADARSRGGTTGWSVYRLVERIESQRVLRMTVRNGETLAYPVELT